MAEAPDINTLANAAARGDLEETKKLLECNIDVNTKNKYDRTPLQVGKLGNPEITEALLRAGADPNVRDRCKQLTLMHDAARDGHADTVHVLLQYGADANLRDTDGNLPLHLAAREGHRGTVELLAPHTHHPFSSNHAGFTPGQLATQHHRDDTARWLESYRQVPSSE
ncbi:cyclin-dependent kinase 4 inhibitor C [Silurus meridionalis]|nr:cyclin-dependent kinase 4 inhibitor C [Silurus meridionalis]